MHRGGAEDAESRIERDSRLYLVTFRVHDEVGFFNAALALGRRRPASLKLRTWLISTDGTTSYALWEATAAAVLLGVLDVEFGDSADYELTEVNLLYAT